MNKDGVIVVIEDDADDQQIFADIFRNLGLKNPVIYFSESEKALAYLTVTKAKPFLILSDINMPRLNGFELRERIHTNQALDMKCIPYLFFTTTSNQKAVIEAYSQSVQGFFIKPASVEKFERMISMIIGYWQECEAPRFIAD